MRGLGRLLTLPWLLIALAVQALAPAEAAAMQPDPAGLGICSARDLGGGSHRPDPAKGHDCCAFACALAHSAANPPVHAFPRRIAFAAPVDLAAAPSSDAPIPSPLERPRARAPPPRS
jgi:hypothetical protein